MTVPLPGLGATGVAPVKLAPADWRERATQIALGHHARDWYRVLGFNDVFGLNAEGRGKNTAETPVDAFRHCYSVGGIADKLDEALPAFGGFAGLAAVWAASLPEIGHEIAKRDRSGWMDVANNFTCWRIRTELRRHLGRAPEAWEWAVWAFSRIGERHRGIVVNKEWKQGWYEEALSTKRRSIGKAIEELRKAHPSEPVRHDPWRGGRLFDRNESRPGGDRAPVYV